MSDRAGAAATVVVFACACGGVAALQPPLAAVVHEVKEGDDVYALPPPAELRVSTLGWDAAMTDLLWARLIGEYGTHWNEHREFHDIPKYADAIVELEPTFWPLYRLIDTLLVYRPLVGTEADARLARRYLELGTVNRPGDWRAWVKYGQFLALMAPSFLRNPAERDAWRREGAEALSHAVELGADAEHAITAANILSSSGARDLTIDALARAYSFTPENSEAHAAIARKLAALEARAQRDRTDAADRAVDAAWQGDLPYVRRELYLLVGPRRPVDRCAGVLAASDATCDGSWGAFLDGVSAPGSSAGSP